MERRQGQNNRRSFDEWDSNTHDLVLIALEKNSNPDLNEGDQVVLGQTLPHPAPGTRDISSRPVLEPEIDPSTQSDSEQDYVLHLSINSGKRPVQ